MKNMAKYQVIIIGAGVAGLTAANELIKNGVNDILIIEAQNRAGGRINTIDFDSKDVIELGAQWIHGQGDNPIYKLCNQLNLVDESVKTIKSDQFYCFTESGNRIEIDEEFDSIFHEIETIFYSLRDYKNDEDKRIITYIDEKFQEFLQTFGTNDNNSNHKKEIAKALCYYFAKEVQAITGCDSLHELTIHAFNQYDNFEGDWLTNLKNGYGKLIDYLLLKIPQNTLKFNEVVTKIEYQGVNEPSGRILITTRNVITKIESQFTAIHCLCTISLGCLKANHRTLFEPNLPQNKIDAIEKLGFGTVNKIFLIFDEEVFKEEVQGLMILWRDNFKLKLQSVEKWNLENTDFFKYFTPFEAHPAIPNVLYTFVTGENAIYTEKLETQCLFEVINELLEKCFQGLKLPKLKKIIRSQWSTNEYTRGSYSFIPYGASIKDIQNLSNSVDSRLHFAGEATHITYFSSVHGGYTTGLESANRIINLLKSDA